MKYNIQLQRLTDKCKLKNGVYLVKRNDDKTTMLAGLPYDIMSHKHGKWYNNFDLAFHYPNNCVSEYLLLKTF